MHFPVAFDQSKHFTSRVCIHTLTRSHTETAETCTLGRINQSGAMRQLQGQYLALRPGSRVMRWDQFNTRELLVPPEKHQFSVLRRLFLSKIGPPALCLRFCLFFKDTSASLAPSLTFYESIKRVSRALRWSIIPSRLFYTAASL